MRKAWNLEVMEEVMRARYVSAYLNATPSKNEAVFVQPIKCEYCGQDDWVTRRDEIWCRGCGAEHAPQLEAAQKREYNEKYRAALYQIETLLDLNYLPRDKKSEWAWLEKMGRAFGL